VTLELGCVTGQIDALEASGSGVISLREDTGALLHNLPLRGFFKNRGYSDPAKIEEREISQPPLRAGDQELCRYP
jgi:hypothetical protein